MVDETPRWDDAARVAVVVLELIPSADAPTTVDSSATIHPS
jgi:hypothetical protein